MALHLGLQLGGHPGPDSAADRSAGAPPLPGGSGVCLAWRWRGYGGVYVFGTTSFPLYLSAQAHVVFFDAAQPAVGFFLDYLAILGLLVWLAHYGGRGCRPWPGGKAAGVGSLGEKTAEPLGSAVMPVSDLFACR